MIYQGNWTNIVKKTYIFVIFQGGGGGGGSRPPVPPLDPCMSLLLRYTNYTQTKSWISSPAEYVSIGVD